MRTLGAMHPEAVFAIMALLSSALLAVPPGNESIEVFRFSNLTEDTRLSDFHLLLRKRLEYEVLSGDAVVKAWNATHNDTLGYDRAESMRFRFSVYGEFAKDPQTNDAVLSYVIEDRQTAKKFQQQLALKGMALEEAADIVVLKARSQLKSTILGQLNVMSTPAGCQVFLNESNAGRTPREFTLEPGKYRIQVRGDYLFPFKREVDVRPGRTTDLDVQMNFKGFPVAYWLAASALFSGLAAVTWVIENQYHYDYVDLNSSASQAEFDRKFAMYRGTQVLRTTFQTLAVIGWTGTGFCIYLNWSLRKRTFGQKDFETSGPY